MEGCGGRQFIFTITVPLFIGFNYCSLELAPAFPFLTKIRVPDMDTSVGETRWAESRIPRPDPTGLTAWKSLRNQITKVWLVVNDI